MIKFKEELREAENKDFGTRLVHKFPYKIMVWTGITFQGVTDVVILPQKMSFDMDFYIENVLPIVKRDEKRFFGPERGRSTAKKKSFNNVHKLAQKIKECVKKISLKSIQDAIDNFRSRVYQVEKNFGGLILN